MHSETYAIFITSMKYFGCPTAQSSSFTFDESSFVPISDQNIKLNIVVTVPSNQTLSGMKREEVDA